MGELAPRGHGFEVVHHAASDLGDRVRAAGAERAFSPRTRFEDAVRTAVALAGVIRREGYDLVVTTTRSDLKRAGLAARLAGHPGVVARLNSGWSADDPVVRSGFRWRRHRAYHRQLVQLAATNSAAGRDDLVARGFVDADRVVTIYNGVDLVRFDPARVGRGRFRAELGIPGSAPLVVSIARYVPDRGQEAVVEAFARLTADRRDLHAVVLGSCRSRDESFKASLAERFAEAGGGRLHVLGARDDVPEILADADVLVRVMTTEGLANVALEAMAMHVPVVGGDAGGMAEAIVEGETGMLVRPGDASAIVAATGKLLDLTPEARRAMGERGRARVASRFSLSRMADRYAQLFARALDERRRR